MATTRQTPGPAASKTSRLVTFAGSAGRRLRCSFWAIAQTSVAAGLAWYIAHDLLGHPRPFFAPIAAAVTLSASNVMRGNRALQLIGGVILGIATGIGVQTLLGVGPVAVGVAVLIALCVAVTVGKGIIAQGLMFVNQTAAAAILILATQQTAGPERLVDALIGGAIALVISILLFPAAPLPLLRNAERCVLLAMRDTLAKLDLADGDGSLGPDWTLAAAEHINAELAELTQARRTAREIVRVCPRRRAQQPAVAAADQRAAQLALLAAALLSLAQVRATALRSGEPLPAALRAATRELACAMATLADRGDGDATAAAMHASKAACLAEQAISGRPTGESVIIASITLICAGDLARMAA